MIRLEKMIDAFDRTVRITGAQTNGLTHEESLLQLPFRGNCLNWVVGHILDSRNGLLHLIGAEPVLAEACARYGRGSAPVTSDGEGVIRLEALLEGFHLANQRTATRLSALRAEEFSAPVMFIGREQPLGDAIFFLYFHETYHLGQLEQLRQLSGKNDGVI